MIITDYLNQAAATWLIWSHIEALEIIFAVACVCILLLACIVVRQGTTIEWLYRRK